MTKLLRRYPLAALASTVVAAVAACGVPAVSAAVVTPATVSASSADSTVTLVVPAGEGGGALSTPRKLTVPSGWTARVWARVPGARMEAWTPQGDLLVSVPSAGKIMSCGRT